MTLGELAIMFAFVGPFIYGLLSLGEAALDLFRLWLWGDLA